MVGFVQGEIRQCYTIIWKVGQREGNVAKVRQGAEMEDEVGRLNGVWAYGEV